MGLGTSGYGVQGNRDCGSIGERVDFCSDERLRRWTDHHLESRIEFDDQRIHSALNSRGAGDAGDSAQCPGDSAECPGNSAECPGDSAECPGNSAECPGDRTACHTAGNPGDAGPDLVLGHQLQ
jgi:hypothetical protein